MSPFAHTYAYLVVWLRLQRRPSRGWPATQPEVQKLTPRLEIVLIIHIANDTRRDTERNGLNVVVVAAALG